MNVEGDTSSSTSKELIIGKSQKYGLWVNKNKWRRKKVFDNPNVDLQITYKTKIVGIICIFKPGEYDVHQAWVTKNQ